MRRFLAFAAIIALLLPAFSGCTYIKKAAELYKEVGMSSVIDFIDAPSSDVEFSHQGGFYTDGIEVSLANVSEREDAVVRYTLDGSAPTGSSEVYTSAIACPVMRGEAVYIIRAALFEEGVMVSDCAATNTYFVGSDTPLKYNVPVIFLSTDESHLYDYDTGIFSDGRMRDEWRANVMTEGMSDYELNKAPANWWMHGRDWERPMYVEIYEPDGTRVIAQDAGVRVSGGWSRINDIQRSLRLRARREYDPANYQFRHEIFPQLTSVEGANARIDSFKQLVLRNGGNDFYVSRIRDEVMQDIAREAGLHTQASRAAVIYLNGAFYGIAQIKQHYNANSLEDMFGLPDDNITLLEQESDGDRFLMLDGWDDEREIFEALLDEIKYGMASTEEGRSIIERSIDVEQVLKYYAAELYIGNGDWPNSNFKVWKYNAQVTPDELSPADGRWRCLLFDTDYGMGLYDNTYLIDRMKACMVDIEDRGLFSGLMMYDKWRDYFIRVMCDLMNDYYTQENIEEKIGLRMLEIAQAIPLQHEPDVWSYRCQAMVKWNVGRTGAVVAQMQQYLDAGEPYEVELSVSEGGRVWMNEFELTETSWQGTYLRGSGAFVRAQALPGYVLEGWVIDGQTVLLDTPLLDRYNASGKVSAKAIFRPLSEDESNGQLVINEIVYDGFECDYVEIYNPTPYPVFMYNRSLSDKLEKPFRFMFPKVTIEPYSYLVVYCTTDASTAPEGALVANFGLKEGEETVCLFSEGILTDSVELPLIKNGKEAYGRFPDGAELMHLQKLTPNAPNEMGEKNPSLYGYMRERVIMAGNILPVGEKPIRIGDVWHVPARALEFINTPKVAELYEAALAAVIEVEGRRYFPVSALDDGVTFDVICPEGTDSVVINNFSRIW